MLGVVEKCNAVRRTILESLISDRCAMTADDLERLLYPAIHSFNSSSPTKDEAFTTLCSGGYRRFLAASLPTKEIWPRHLIRNEALQHLSAMNVDRELRRALLRKTRKTISLVRSVPAGGGASVDYAREEPGVSCRGPEPRQTGVATQWQLHRLHHSGRPSVGLRTSTAVRPSRTPWSA